MSWLGFYSAHTVNMQMNNTAEQKLPGEVRAFSLGSELHMTRDMMQPMYEHSQGGCAYMPMAGDWQALSLGSFRVCVNP